MKAWLTATPSLAAGDQKAQNAKGHERYIGFLETLSRRLGSGRLLRGDMLQDQDGNGQSWRDTASDPDFRIGRVGW